MNRASSKLFILLALNPLAWTATKKAQNCFAAIQSTSIVLKARNFNSGQYYEGDNVNGYRRALDKIAGLYNKTRGTQPPAKTILYLFAGSDAGILRAFPDADTLIMSSMSPFFSQRPSVSEPIQYVFNSGVFSPERASTGWRKSHELYNQEVGPDIIGSLEANIDGFQLEKVEVIEQLGSDADSKHGVIYFNQGPGTRTRKVIHLHVIFGKESVKGTWWYNWIKTQKPGVWIEKASNGLYTPEWNPTLVADVTALCAKDAYLIETRTNETDNPQGAVTGLRPSNPRQILNLEPRGRVSSTLTGIEIGYDHRVQIWPINQVPRN